MQEVIVYSKPHCPSCVKAKALFDNLNVEYKTFTLGTDIQPSELMALFEEKGLPAPRTAPQVFIGDQHIGGYEQLISYIETTGWNGTGESLG
jgi:glutaredoxin 3